MYDLYIDLYNKYTQLYGKQTAIFLMVGSFYELYDIQFTDGSTKCNVKDVIDVLGIQLTIKKDIPAAIAVPKDSVGLFAGVPDYSIHKWAGRLTGVGWTVVIVDQVKDTKGAVESRQVARILSPATHLEALGTADTAYVLGLVLRENPSLSTAPAFTAAAFDLSTGRTYTFDGALNGRGDIWYSDTLTHFLQVFAPREMVVWWQGAALSMPSKQHISKVFNIPQTTAIHIREYKVGLLESPLIQDEYLRRLYNIRSALPTQEWLWLTPAEQPGLILLLKFIEEHLPSSFERLERNQRWVPIAADGRGSVRLGNAALSQLQMITPNLRESVLGLFDACVTPMGKRGIRARILNPINDPAEINSRLDRIQKLLALPTDHAASLLTALRSIYDMPRIHRRLLCGVITPQEIVNLHTTYLATKNLLQIPSVSSIYKCTIKESVGQLLNALEAAFNIKKAEQASPDISFFHNGHYPAADKAEEKIAAVRTKLQKFIDDIAMKASVQKDALSLEDKNGALVIRGSLKTMKTLQAIPEFKTSVHLLKSGGWYEHQSLSALGYELLDAQTTLKRAIEKAIPIACEQLAATQEVWREVEEFIECVDIDRCVALTSEERRWCRPTIVKGTSHLVFDNLRHPLIESTLTRTQYVKHNVALTPDSRGWLIYGMNASGKSSLMKSVGIAVLLAQAGCFVPASRAEIAPFSSLFTRILNQDNLWAGLSSFAVEMSEMREILNYADQNTLVLGDELCSGTASASAHALVAAGIDWLAAKQSKYIFATPLHGLLDILPPPHALSLSVYHLKVVYDAINDRLVYERVLTPGPGTSLYGLEVAKAMHVPQDYYEKALKYRNKFVGDKALEEITESSWNPHILRKGCELCGSAIGMEVHHIRQRKDTVEGKEQFADGDARDDARNLVVVCAACHDAHHAGTISIAPVKQTSEGPMRLVESPSLSPLPSPSPSSSSPMKSTPISKSKWSPDDLAVIETMLREYSASPLKRISVLLKAEGITISEGSLRSIRAKLVTQTSL